MNNNLLESCRQGNEIAKMQVYDQYCEAMFTIACRYLVNEEDAWLKRIIINQCLDVLKKNKLEFEEVEVSELKVIDDDDWNFDIAISKTDILLAIEQLNKKYKIVVKLYLLEGYDHQEISEILDIPIKTSRTHLRRGKLGLKKLLKERYNEARY